LRINVLEENRLKFSATNIIILVTILAFILQQFIQNAEVIFGLNLYFFTGLYFQIISNMFIHANFEHILMNMFVLWQFGNIVEQYTSRAYLLFLYFFGGILTSVLVLIYMVLTKDFVTVIGASGAISVILGFIALKDKFNRVGIIIWFLLITFGPLLFGENIAWHGHIFGFIIGIILGLFKKV